MKNVIFNYSSTIRLTIVFLFWANLFSQHSMAQDAGIEQYLKGLPNDLELNEDVPQRYHIVTDYFNKDIFGNFMNKMRVTGDYTRGLDNGIVKWNNVFIASSDGLEKPFPEGEKQEYMENFTYIPSEKMMLESSYENFPQQNVHVKNLVWDMMGIEVFAWMYFDSLKLNESFSATELNEVVEMDGIGTFENKDIRLTWTGISSMNNEICAVIEYITMDNPIDAKFGDFKMKGRSHYWGTIWVSLEDKQIEHAMLFEDVVMDMKLPGQPNNQLINTTREIVFEKLNEEF